jgi:hypothetical protein
LTRREGPCYPESVRALPNPIARAAVAVVLLALFAAPLARASAALAATPHSCCPEAPASPDPAPPCQQIAPLSCCLEIGVPPAHGDEARPAELALALPSAPLPAPAAPRARLAPPSRASEGPPLAPLAQTSVLLL